MEEKRKHKRLDLDVNVQLERLAEENGITTLKYLHVDVTDVSKSGIGFISDYTLDIGTYYDTKIQIWTKEVVDVVIEIVRREEREGGYQYGAIFIGMNDTDALKIEIYQLFNHVE
jgi:predicted nucleic-acid-binding protein